MDSCVRSPGLGEQYMSVETSGLQGLGEQYMSVEETSRLRMVEVGVAGHM